MNIELENEKMAALYLNTKKTTLEHLLHMILGMGNCSVSAVRGEIRNQLEIIETIQGKEND